MNFTALQDIPTALALLEKGDVVAIPTETVYGLAARIDRQAGLEKIFQVKERPFFDPLIVHVDSIAMAQSLAREWSQSAQVLTQTFWPGPLTLVLPKSERVSDLITSGLDSVGLRCPRHLVTLELIRSAGVGLAAPSANKFGRTSPTTWQHVLAEFGDSVFILKDEAGQVGIESTVLAIRSGASGDELAILRPGMITAHEIETALVNAGLRCQWKSVAQHREAPGQMKHHYMPSVPLLWLDQKRSVPEILAEANRRASEIPDAVEGVPLNTLRKEKAPGVFFLTAAALELSNQPELAARGLYSQLRSLSESGVDLIYFCAEPTMQGEHWTAILERLTKATSLKLS